MLKAYKFRLYPTKEQEILINKTFGCTRFIYNYFLDKMHEYYKENNKSLSAYDCCKEIKELSKEKEWLTEVDSCSLRCSIFDLEDAFKRFFKKTGNYPKFKKKFGKNSYRTNCITSSYKGTDYANISVDLKSKTIKLPKLKNCKIRGYRNLENLNGRIINATVIKDSSNRYYVSVVVEENTTNIITNTNHNIVGIDLGIKELITTSEGETFENPKVLKRYERRIIRLQRELSRKQKDSKNYYKCKEKLGVLYRKIKNTRNYYLHKVSKTITDNYKIIVTETLKIKNMLKNSQLSKSIQDASWFELNRQLKYKSYYKNNKFYQIESNYASSQICSRCGIKNNKIKDLKIRKWECSCGMEHNRDINAAINIMIKGLEKYLIEIV